MMARSAVLFAGLLLVPGMARGETLPSVAINRLQAKQGVSPDVADVVTEHVVAEVRRSKRFSRVVSARDIEAALALENSKQLLDCNSDSCAAEIAGALGVDLIIAGSLGRVGREYVFNLSLIRARTATGEGSVSQLLGDDESALLREVPRIVGELLGQPVSAKVQGPTAAAPVGAEPTRAGPPVKRIGAGVVGVGGAVMAGLLVVGGLAAAAGVAGLLAYFTTVPGLGPNENAVFAVSWAGAAVSVVSLLGALGLGALAVGSAVAFMVVE